MRAKDQPGASSGELGASEEVSCCSAPSVEKLLGRKGPGGWGGENMMAAHIPPQSLASGGPVFESSPCTKEAALVGTNLA